MGPGIFPEGKVQSSDSIPFQACFESSPKSLPCSRHYTKIPPCCPSSKGKQWRAFMVVMVGRVRVSHEKVPLFFNLVLCLHCCQSFSMSACLFFCLFICSCSVCLPDCFSVSQPVHFFFLVFPCLLWHCLPTFLLPDSVCLTLRLSVFLLSNLSACCSDRWLCIFSLSVCLPSLFFPSLHPSACLKLTWSLCVSVFACLPSGLSLTVCLWPMTFDHLYLFFSLFEYQSLPMSSSQSFSFGLHFGTICLPSCFFLSLSTTVCLFLFICFFVSVSLSLSFYNGLCSGCLNQPVSPPACLCLFLWLSACIYMQSELWSISSSRWLSFSLFFSLALSPSVSICLSASFCCCFSLYRPLCHIVLLSAPLFLIFWSITQLSLLVIFCLSACPCQSPLYVCCYFSFQQSVSLSHRLFSSFSLSGC